MQVHPFRVLVVDDFEPWRRFINSSFRDKPDYLIAGEAEDGSIAVNKARELQPDLILLDIGLPGLNGIEAARQIRHVAPNSTVLFVTENRSRDVAEEALRTGARGYVVKSDAGSQLLPAVQAVMNGEFFLSASLTEEKVVVPENRAILLTA